MAMDRRHRIRAVLQQRTRTGSKHHGDKSTKKALKEAISLRLRFPPGLHLKHKARKGAPALVHPRNASTKGQRCASAQKAAAGSAAGRAGETSLWRGEHASPASQPTFIEIAKTGCVPQVNTVQLQAQFQLHPLQKQCSGQRLMKAQSQVCCRQVTEMLAVSAAAVLFLSLQSNLRSVLCRS